MYEDDDDKKERDRQMATVEAIINKALAKHDANLHELQGMVSALAACVAGLAATVFDPQRTRKEIQRSFRESCARQLGEIDNDDTTRGARNMLDLVGEALGGPIF